MNRLPALELDAASYPEWRDGIVAAESSGDARPGEPRTYPGYPRILLEPVRPRRWVTLDRALVNRRSHRKLATTLPSIRQLSRLLFLSHGITGPHASGPVPSAGGFQALEVYLVAFGAGWLAKGIYHYDRLGHHLSQISPAATHEEWMELVPSLVHIQGGSFLWVIVGDGGRVARKYDERAKRFLLQESGHLMQNLCLLSASLGLSTVPQGGYLERDIARHFQLLATDLVLYVGVCGEVAKRGEG